MILSEYFLIAFFAVWFCS